MGAATVSESWVVRAEGGDRMMGRKKVSAREGNARPRIRCPRYNIRSGNWFLFRQGGNSIQ